MSHTSTWQTVFCLGGQLYVRLLSLVIEVNGFNVIRRLEEFNQLIHCYMRGKKAFKVDYTKDNRNVSVFGKCYKQC